MGHETMVFFVSAPDGTESLHFRVKRNLTTMGRAMGVYCTMKGLEQARHTLVLDGELVQATDTCASLGMEEGAGVVICSTLDAHQPWAQLEALQEALLIPSRRYAVYASVLVASKMEDEAAPTRVGSTFCSFPAPSASARALAKNIVRLPEVMVREIVEFKFGAPGGERGEITEASTADTIHEATALHLAQQLAQLDVHN
ncbi:hypothetical protein TeGR_g8029 [Tetraparma gracilis]|uniref:Rad60/SUMO-like domain-containing protein n=1 Tax=Tetraparma gracilis TaxID=2962635 RepID=A0ABQ6MQL6_9STRA|nr:hypothetical protein TeGR_g8029 [Tetraparma gracilis]